MASALASASCDIWCCTARKLRDNKTHMRYYSAVAAADDHKWSPELLHPSPCPLFLQMESGYRSPYGIGHAFMAFNTFLHIASVEHLTVHAMYDVACWPAGRCNSEGLEETPSYFFGNSFALNKPPLNRSRPAEVHSLGAMVDRARDRGECHRTFEFSHSTLNALVPRFEGFSLAGFRQAFRSLHNRESRLRLHSTPSPTRQAATIAVHIRRGDVLTNVLRGRKSKDVDRLIPNVAFQDLMRRVIDAVQRTCRARSSTSITVKLVAEGARDEGNGKVSVPDYDGRNTTFDPHSVEWRSSGVRFLVAGAGKVLDAFESLCYADLTIGGKSGFVHTVACLCDTPVLVVAMRHSDLPLYTPLPNVLAAVESNHTMHNHSTFRRRSAREFAVHDEYLFKDRSLGERIGREAWCVG